MRIGRAGKASISLMRSLVIVMRTTDLTIPVPAWMLTRSGDDAGVLVRIVTTPMSGTWIQTRAQT